MKDETVDAIGQRSCENTFLTFHENDIMLCVMIK